MRVGIVRSDIGKVYLSDVENRSQRCFSSEPAGQSRNFVKPTDDALLAVLNAKAILSAKGDNASATSNTTGGNNVLRVRTNPVGTYSVITVTSNAALSKAQLAADLNTGFLNAGLPLVATVLAAPDLNKIQIDTVYPETGPSATLQIDTTANGSTLNAALHSTWAAGPPNLAGLSVAALKAAVYPSATTINVASATITALSTFASMQTAAQTALVTAVQDAVAPALVETGPVLLSFVYGVLSKLRSTAFQPGGARIGLPAGVAAAIVANDGSTVFTL
jgi:hypothetical protein